MRKETKNEPTLEYDSNPFTLSFRGFGLLADYARGVLIVLLVLSGLGFVANMASNLVDLFKDDTATFQIDDSGIQSDTAIDPLAAGEILVLIGIILGAVVFIGCIALIISTIFKGFVAAGTVAASEKRHITVGEAFSEMSNRFGALLVAELVAGLKILGGYLLLIVPGVRAQLRYQALPYVVMTNKEMSGMQALRETKRLYNGHLMESFGITTVGALIPLIGGAIAACGYTLSAKQIAAYDKAKQETPNTHVLNYLGVMLIAAGLLIVTLIAILIGIIIVRSS